MNNHKTKEIEEQNGMVKVSIILPCRNEEQALPICLDEIKKIISQNQKNNENKYELIIVNNNSSDRTEEIARNFAKLEKNCFVYNEEIEGYGSASRKGASLARGKFLIFADADMSYDFSLIPSFEEKLKSGNELVLGNRFGKKMELRAMPWHHKFIGNPLLSFLVRIFFGVKLKDIHCGMRAIRRTAFNKLNLQTNGMEFASEMVIKAAKRKMAMAEIPILYRQRLGKSKLRSMADGWRHLRFLLLFSPLPLFLIPGFLLMLIGLFSGFYFYFSSNNWSDFGLGTNPIFFSSFFIIIGYQLVFFSFFAKIYAIVHLKEADHIFEKIFKFITIEKAGFLGIAITALGTILLMIVVLSNNENSVSQFKNGIPFLTLIALGVQTFFSAFMLSILGIKEK